MSQYFRALIFVIHLFFHAYDFQKGTAYNLLYVIQKGTVYELSWKIGIHISFQNCKPYISCIKVFQVIFSYTKEQIIILKGI